MINYVVYLHPNNKTNNRVMKNKKFYPWLVVALLWVVALLNYMDRQMLSTMKSAMMVDIVELESAADSVTRDICDKRIGKKG